VKVPKGSGAACIDSAASRVQDFRLRFNRCAPLPRFLFRAAQQVVLIVWPSCTPLHGARQLSHFPQAAQNRQMLLNNRKGHLRDLLLVRIAARSQV
jgi:hypothetical protein